MLMKGSFFSPSPTANPEGVGEGHQVLDKVPFFSAIPRGRLTRWVHFTQQKEAHSGRRIALERNGKGTARGFLA